MSVVPYVNGPYGRGYLPIYEIGGKANVNVAQLVLNISFAALAGALVSNLSRRAAIWMATIVGLAVAALFGLGVYHEQLRNAAEREKRLADEAMFYGKFDLAKQHLLNASNYWWWKGWWEGARNARERALDERAMRARHFDPSTAVPVFDPVASPTPQPIVMILRQTKIKIPYGETVLPRGMRLPIVSRGAATVTIEYLGATYPIPIESTDVR